MGQFLRLESFDSGADIAATEHPEFLRGKAVGLAEGAVSANAAQAELLNSIHSELNDARFTYSEARQSVIADLDAVISAALKQLIPALAQHGLITTIMNELAIAIDQNSDAIATVTVHESLVDPLSDIVAEAFAKKVLVKAGKYDGPMVAWVNHGQTHKCVNFENSVVAIDAALGCLRDAPERIQDYG